MWTLLVVSAVLLALGLIALLSDQPYGVWYGLGLAGFIGVAVIGANAPVVYRVYRAAEERKLAAPRLDGRVRRKVEFSLLIGPVQERIVYGAVGASVRILVALR